MCFKLKTIIKVKLILRTYFFSFSYDFERAVNICVSSGFSLKSSVLKSQDLHAFKK